MVLDSLPTSQTSFSLLQLRPKQTVARETVQPVTVCHFPVSSAFPHSLWTSWVLSPHRPHSPTLSVLAFHTEVLFSKILIQIQVTCQGLSHGRFSQHFSSAGIHLISQVQLRVTVIVPMSNLCSAQALTAVSTILSFAVCSTIKY